MPEYRAVRKQHSLIEICKKPQLAADVTITAAEFLKVDAAIIFADLLLPLEVMGLPFHFSAGEGPVIESPVRSSEDIRRLRTDSAGDLGYVAEAVSLVAKHFGRHINETHFESCREPLAVSREVRLHGRFTGGDAEDPKALHLPQGEVLGAAQLRRPVCQRIDCRPNSLR